ncbi:MAG TPA: D-alanyl-D-alanine carboxypeptidase, partial [Pricia sp.]|nr:D-alanyl-D-alanine carboxypeptidase [Pricia sp.]
MQKIVLSCIIGSFLIGCASAKKNIQRTTDDILETHFYKNQFTGFLVVDADSKDTLYALNATRYFTPASNTKIFTLYAGLTFLPDKVPALKYLKKNDTLFVKGTGDPSFLHPVLKDSTGLEFLRKHRNIALYLNNFQEYRLGPGWSWGDYQYYYQPERNALPLYGNVVTIHGPDSVNVVPSYFEDSVEKIDYLLQREID